jgi:hypothetical protein
LKSLWLATTLLFATSARAEAPEATPPLVHKVDWIVLPIPEFPRSELTATEPVTCTATVDVHRDGTADLVSLAHCQVPFVAPIHAALLDARARWTFDEVVPPGAGDTVRAKVDIKFVPPDRPAARSEAGDGRSPWYTIPLGVLWAVVGWVALRQVKRGADGKLPPWPVVEGVAWLAAGALMLISALAADLLGPALEKDVRVYTLFAVLLWQAVEPVNAFFGWVRRKVGRSGGGD